MYLTCFCADSISLLGPDSSRRELSNDPLITLFTSAILELSALLRPPSHPFYSPFQVLSSFPLPQICFSCHTPSWSINSLPSLGLGLLLQQSDCRVDSQGFVSLCVVVGLLSVLEGLVGFGCGLA